MPGVGTRHLKHYLWVGTVTQMLSQWLCKKSTITSRSGGRMCPPGEEPPSPVFQSTLCPMACMALHWRHSSKYWKHYWLGFFFPPSEYLQTSSSWIVSKQYQKGNTICQRGLSKDKIPGVPWVQIDHRYPHDAESIFGLLLFQECQDMPYLKRNACIIYMTHTSLLLHPNCKGASLTCMDL